MFYTFIHFISLFTFCISCFQSSRPVLPHHVHLMEMETYATYDQCNFTLIVPKKVINPYKNEFQNLVEQKPFGSFCLKCAACLAVAEQIAITVQKTLEDSKIDEKGQDFANEELRKRINTLCTSGFKNFDLRKYDDNSLVTNKLKCTEHINTKMDGNWTKKLREMCNLYTSYMDLKHLSNDYVDKTGEIATNLCSGTGIFRDCQNIEYEGISRIMDELSCCDDCKCGK